jgi:hypothetical protein
MKKTVSVLLGALFLVAIAVGCFAAGAEAPIPPVYFNHADIVLDPAVYDAIAQSPFLKEQQFSVFGEHTIRRPRPSGDGTYSYTSLGLSGEQTYLAFFKFGHAPHPVLGEMPRGQVNFNMWTDDRLKLPMIRDSLARETHTDATLRQIKAFVDGQSANSFDTTRAGFPNNTETVRTATSVISRYPEFIRQLYPDAQQPDTSRKTDQRLGKRYSPDRLLNDITRFTLTVNQAEAERLLQEFRAYGYTIRTNGARQIAAGPEFEFVFVPAESGAPRKLAIDMKLNRVKTGNQSYQFADSELRFSGSTATWYFPADWRP